MGGFKRGGGRGERQTGGDICVNKSSLLIKKRDLSVCLSGYTFRHALMSHADILDIDRGHIFRKHRHKNNKKVAVIYEKTVKNRPLPGYLPPVAMGRIH